MSKMINVEVVTCNEGQSKNYVLKLKTQGQKVEVFKGVFKEKVGLTYYMSLKNPVEVGTQQELNLDLFDIVEKPYDVLDKTTGELTTIMLKWLWLK